MTALCERYELLCIWFPCWLPSTYMYMWDPHFLYLLVISGKQGRCACTCTYTCRYMYLRVTVYRLHILYTQHYSVIFVCPFFFSSRYVSNILFWLWWVSISTNCTACTYIHTYEVGSICISQNMFILRSSVPYEERVDTVLGWLDLPSEKRWIFH